MSNKLNIFVLIASYRDPECSTTVKDLYKQAKYPRNINTGICWQFSEQDSFDCIEADQSFFEQIKIDRVPYNETGGVVWARHRAQQFYNDEEYILIIDSHMLFEKFWDEKLIKEYQDCPTKKAVLSAYPPGFQKPNVKQYISAIINSARWHNLKYPPITDKYPDGNIRGSNFPVIKQAIYKYPLRGAFIAAGYLFMPRKALKEVPFDPFIDWDEEEMSFSIRLWSYGWNIYAPKQHYIHHLYGKHKPRASATPEPKTDSQKHQIQALNEKTEKRYFLSKKRYFHLLGLIPCNEPEVLEDINKYSLGKIRSIRAFEAFSGIYLLKQYVSIRAIKSWFSLGSEAHKLNKPFHDLLFSKMKKKFFERTQKKDIEETKKIDTRLETMQQIIQQYHVKSLLELPCGLTDWSSNHKLKLASYIAADFIPEVINWREKHQTTMNKQDFRVIDIRYDTLQKQDLIFVNDCFTRLNYEELTAALYQIKQSGSKYLLTAHYKVTQNRGMKLMTGKQFPLNFLLQPYSFPEPLEIYANKPTEKKYWALWCISDIPNFIATPLLRKDFKNDTEICFDDSLNFNEIEYLFSMRYYDCHLEQENHNPLIIDQLSMNISSVYQQIMSKFSTLYCFDDSKTEMQLYYFDTIQGNIEITSTQYALIIPLILESSSVNISLSNTPNNYLLRMGSILKVSSGNISYELQKSDSNSEWALMIIKPKLIS